MRGICWLLLCTTCLGFFGCTIHPIPYDVPGYRTIDIVKKIRCEAQRALAKFLPEDAKRLAVYDEMSIAYQFTFTITENNKLGADASFKMPVSTGTFTLGISSGVEKERLGQREFTFVDKFKEARQQSVCVLEATGPDYKYPITGTIGLEEVIKTYLELQAVGLGDRPGIVFDTRGGTALAARARGAAQKQDKGTVDFAETFEFTTTIRGSASPKVELKPVGSGLALASASGSLSVDRTDKHALLITLSPNYTTALLSIYNQNVNQRLRRIENSTRLTPLLVPGL